MEAGKDSPLTGLKVILIPMLEHSSIKIVGKRRPPLSPAECLHRAWRLQQQAERLSPYPPARGFVFKARTWADYEAWRRAQTNPRLW